MKPTNKFRWRCSHCLLMLAVVSLFTESALAAPVSPAEAVAIANVWFAMELNSGYLKISETEKAERFGGMDNCKVQYMVSKDELLDAHPQGQRVMAYIVQYVPDGFVVVSGDDRLEPIMVYSTDSRFRWDHPEENFLRYYLGKVMPALWASMPAQTHKNWSLMRAKLSESKDKVTFVNKDRDLSMRLYTALWNQWDYYNDTCQVHNGNNYVPTGCVATAMAIKMRFHRWPVTGTGSHSYSDTEGDIRYSHSVDYSNQSYNWASMPLDTLSAPNSEIARIMYHSGVAVDMDYELDASGASTLGGDALNNYFRYRGTSTIFDTLSQSTHEVGMKISIIGRLPVQVGYYTSNSGHAVIADGYRTDQINQWWYINCGWNGINNGWYQLDHLPPGNGVIAVSCPYGQPNNWIYVDKNWTGTEDGRIAYPYNTLIEGEAASINNGELLIKTGDYTGTGNVPITFDNAVAIRSYAGNVKIGGALLLVNRDLIGLSSGAIKLHGNGQLRITPAKAEE